MNPRRIFSRQVPGTDMRTLPETTLTAPKFTYARNAARAGVSQSVVGRDFTPSTSANRNMIAKVRNANTELSNRPNVLARAMVLQKAGIIDRVIEKENGPSAVSQRKQVNGSLIIRGSARAPREGGTP